MPGIGWPQILLGFTNADASAARHPRLRGAQQEQRSVALIRHLDDWMASRQIGSTRFRRVNWTLLWVTIRNWGVVLVGLVMAQGLGALVTVVVARRVVPVDFGQYLASYGLASLIVVVPSLGLDGWLLAQGQADPAHVAQLWDNALRVRLRLLFLWLVFMAALGAGLPQAPYPLP